MVPSLFPKKRGGQCFLNAWTEYLLLSQNMNGQRWRSAKGNHGETEPKGLVGVFNEIISLGNLFERLLNWEGMQGLLD